MKFILILLTLLSSIQAQALVAKWIEMRVLEHPSIAQKTQLVEIAENELKNAHALFYPKFQLSSQFGLMNTDPKITDNQYLSNATFRVEQNLWNNWIDSYEVDIKKLNLKRAQLNLNQEKSQLALKMTTQYLNLKYAYKNLKILKDYTNELSEQANRTRSRYQQGIVVQKEYLRFLGESERAALSYDQAVLDYQQLELEFKTFLTDKHESLESLLNAEFRPSHKLVLKEDNLLSYQVKQNQNEIFDLQQKQNRQQKWPELKLLAEASHTQSDFWSSTNDVDLSKQNQYGIFFQLRWDFLDFGVQNRAIQNQKLFQSNEFIQINQQLQENLTQFQILKQKAEFLDQKKLKTLQILENEKKSYLIAQKDYRSGVVSYYDFTTSLEYYLRAQQNFIRTDLDSIENQVKIAHLMGEAFEYIQK